jgi:hypothetical protein
MPGRIAATPGPRFTCDGSEELERHLQFVCARVREAVQGVVPSSGLAGLLLGGGYGRGEGGVLRTSHGDQPYNDLEFYVILSRGLRLGGGRFRRELQRVAGGLSAVAGVEVEFKLLGPDELRRSEPTMFYYDLVMGHRRLLGGESLVEGCDQHREASRIPLSEAARLWMNRATGLLFAAGRLAQESFDGDDADFVGRNLAKLRLALGDIVLAAVGRYHWSCRERSRRLYAIEARGLPFDLGRVRQQHDAGVEFKLRPVRSQATRESLARELQHLARLAGEVFLWLERLRLGVEFPDLRGYALSPVDKCPGTPAWKNALLTARALGLGAVLRPGGLRYPRARLLEALALLLASEAPGGADRDLPLLQQKYHTCDSTLQGWIEVHKKLWHRFG